jgi:hypothetical protein
MKSRRIVTMTRDDSEMIAYVRSITLRLPDEVAAWVDALAKAERRSLNSQIVILIERAMAEAERKLNEDRGE